MMMMTMQHDDDDVNITVMPGSFEDLAEHTARHSISTCNAAQCRLRSELSVF